MIPRAPASRDTDGDGLPDDWEIAHGTNPGKLDANADPDNDGLTNAQEFLAGTDPKDAASCLKVSRIIVGPSNVKIEFSAVSSRTYSVFFKQTIHDVGWTKLADVPAQSANRFETVIDSTPRECEHSQLQD